MGTLKLQSLDTNDKTGYRLSYQHIDGKILDLQITVNSLLRVRPGTLAFLVWDGQDSVTCLKSIYPRN
jgi:hypothetical protein